MKLRVLVADDHPIVRTGLRALIDAEPDMWVDGEAGSGDEVLRLVAGSDWSVILLDLGMPGQSGLDTLLRLHKTRPQAKLLIYSGRPESEYAVNLIRAGAQGFFGKDRPLEDLPPAIRMVGHGQRYVSPGLAQLLAEGIAEPQSPLRVHELLSEREFQVFAGLASGGLVSDLASRLHLSVKTVSTYRTRVMKKTGLKTTADLTSYAIRHGLIE